MNRLIQTSSIDAKGKLIIGTGFGRQRRDARAAAVKEVRQWLPPWPNEKTGAYPKISSRCASVGAAVLLRSQPPLVQRPASGRNALMAGGFQRCRLRRPVSVLNPHFVQLPDDLRPPDPFGLAPSHLGLSPITDPEINFLFWRKTNRSSRPSSGSRAVLRVIADWSLVRPFAFR